MHDKRLKKIEKTVDRVFLSYDLLLVFLSLNLLKKR